MSPLLLRVETNIVIAAASAPAIRPLFNKRFRRERSEPPNSHFSRTSAADRLQSTRTRLPSEDNNTRDIEGDKSCISKADETYVMTSVRVDSAAHQLDSI